MNMLWQRLVAWCDAHCVTCFIKGYHAWDDWQLDEACTVWYRSCALCRCTQMEDVDA
jgi:hypothetical protein